MQNERTAAVFEGGAKSNRNSCLDTPSYLTETNGQRFAESMQILAGAPPTGELLVERVKPLRFAEVNGNHAAIFKMLNEGFAARAR